MELSGILLILLGANSLVLVLNITFWVLVSIGERKVKKTEQEMYVKFQQVLEDANKKASQILVQGTARSNQLLANTEVMVEDIKQAMRQSFSQATAKNTELLTNHLQSLSQENQQVFAKLRQDLLHEAQGLLTDIAKQSQAEIGQFVADIKQGTLSVQQDIQQRLEAEFKQALADIDSYRQRQKEKIDKDLNQIVKQLTEEVLATTLTPEQQTQLITEALEKAKEEGVFK